MLLLCYQGFWLLFFFLDLCGHVLTLVYASMCWLNSRRPWDRTYLLYIQGTPIWHSLMAHHCVFGLAQLVVLYRTRIFACRLVCSGFTREWFLEAIETCRLTGNSNTWASAESFQVTQIPTRASFSSANREEKHCIRISVAFRLYLVKIIQILIN
jgi:hypothetical protein